MRNCFALICLGLVFSLAGKASAQLRADVYISGLASPVQFVQDPTRADVQYIVQVGGLIRVVQNGSLRGTNFIDLSGQISTGGERGLLGLAFPPNYASTGFFYVNYTDLNGDTRVTRFSRSTVDPLTANPASEALILRQAQPFDNHNGGCLKFGPDGLLYIGFGDGGSGNDPLNNAQNPNTLLGKMVRIDPTRDDYPADPNKNFGIPFNNPFVSGTPVNALQEIWAFGYRNPWRWSFDSPAYGGTGAMVIGDVGQDQWEEIDYEPAGLGGRNYGWRPREGAHTIIGGSPAYTPLTDPIHEYSHGGNARSVTGGVVYRGSALGASYAGRYFFADYVTGQFWSGALAQTPTGATFSGLTQHNAETGSMGLISSIDTDAYGEIYVVRYSASNGTIYKLRNLNPPSTLLPTSFSVLRGSLVSGGLASLQSPDNDYVIATTGLFDQRGAPIEVEASSVAPGSTSSAMTLVVESQTSAGGMRQNIDAFDYVSNSWVNLDSRLLPAGLEHRLALPITNPSRFVGAGREIRARVSVTYGAANTGRSVDSRIDQIMWHFWQ